MVVLILALVGLWSLLQWPPINAYYQKLMAYLNRPEVRSSIVRAQMERGVKFNQKRQFTPQKSKEQGIWRIAPTTDPNSDGIDLENILHNAQDLDVLDIAPGRYEINEWPSHKSVLIRGIGENINDVQLIIKQKIKFNFDKNSPKKIEFENLTMVAREAQYQSGSLISMQEGELAFFKIHITSSNYENLIHLTRDAQLFMKNSYLSAGQSNDGIFLQDKAQVQIFNSQLSNNKVSITSSVQNFIGKVEIKSSIVENCRAHGIIIYNGTISIDNFKIENCPGGIFLASGVKGSLTNSNIKATDGNALELKYGPVIVVEKSQFESLDTVIMVQGQESKINLQETNIKGGKFGLRLRDGAQVELSNSAVINASDSALFLEKKSAIVAKNSSFSSGESCLESSDSRAFLNKTTLQNCRFGLLLNHNSNMTLDNVTFLNTQEKVKNNFNNSKVIEKK